jgi:hypothetical protein
MALVSLQIPNTQDETDQSACKKSRRGLYCEYGSLTAPRRKKKQVTECFPPRDLLAPIPGALGSKLHPEACNWIIPLEGVDLNFAITRR